MGGKSIPLHSTLSVVQTIQTTGTRAKKYLLLMNTIPDSVLNTFDLQYCLSSSALATNTLTQTCIHMLQVWSHGDIPYFELTDDKVPTTKASLASNK